MAKSIALKRAAAENGMDEESFAKSQKNRMTGFLAVGAASEKEDEKKNGGNGQVVSPAPVQSVAARRAAKERGMDIESFVKSQVNRFNTQRLGVTPEERKAAQDRSEQHRLLTYDLEASRKELDDLSAQLEEAKKARDSANYSLATAGRYAATSEVVKRSKALTAAQERYDELDDKVTALNRDIRTAQLFQDNAKYQAYLSEPDFSRYTGNEKPKDADYMTDEEVGIYNYVLNKYGDESAEEFLDHMQEAVNYRKGKEIGETIRDIDNGLLRFLATGGFAGWSGLDNFGHGAKQLFTEEALPTSTTQYASQYIMEDLGESGAKVPLIDRTWGQLGYETTSTITNMLPSIGTSILVSYLATPAVGAKAGAALAGATGSATLGLSAAGNAYNQAIKDGYTKSQAKTYGTMIGVSEASLSYLLGGISKLTGTGGLSNKVLSKVAGIENGLLKAVATGGVMYASELTEEELQLYLEPLYRTLIFDESYDAPAVEDIVYTAAVTLLTTGSMNAGDIISSAKNNYAKNGKQISAAGSDSVQALIESGLESDKNTESYQLASQMKAKLDSGKTLSNVEIGRLQQANVKAIEAEASQSASGGLMDLARETVAERNASQQAQAEAATDGNSRSNVPYNVLSMDNPVRKARDNAIKNTGYGENGIKAFTEALDASGESVDQMRAKFQNAYELGRFDTPREKVELVTDLQKIAYNAGRLDHIADLGKKVNTSTAGANSGFDTTGAPSFVTSTQTRIVDDLAKALGSSVVIGKSKGNAEISGSGAVVIASDFQTKVGDNDVSIVYHAAHEIGMHRLMQLAPAEGRAFLNAMYNYMSEGRPQTTATLVEEKQSAYAEQDVTLSTDKAAEEVVANNILSLYENEEAFGEAVRRIAEGNDQQAKRGLQKFREILDDVVKKLKSIIAKLTGKEKAEAKQALSEVERLREMYETALAAAVKKNRELVENRAEQEYNGSNEIQNSLKEIKLNFQINFTGEVTSDSIVDLSNREKAAITHNLKTGNGRIDIDGTSGGVNALGYYYLFDVKSDGSVHVTDVVDPDELNIHNTEIGGVYGEEGSSHSENGAAYESGRSGHGHGSERVSASETSRDGRADDRVDGAEQDGNSRGDLQEVQGDRGEVSDYSPDYAYWRNLMKEGSVDGAQFSLKEQNDLLKENAKLKEVNEGLREQFKTTKFAQVDKKSLDKFTKSLLKDYQSGADINEIRDALSDVYNYMANGEDGQSAAWNDLQERAYNVAVSILKEASTVNDEMYQAYKSLRDRLRNYPISIDKAYNNDIQGYESINDFRKANFGRLKISKDGTPVDIVYSDLANTYPEFFDESEYTTQADQLTHIADVLDSLQPYEVNPYSTNMRQAATWLASDIIERFYELPQAKPTFADKQAAKLTKQVIKDAKKLENLREKKNERIKDLIVKNREKVKATTQKERQKRSEAVKEIKDHYKAKEKKASESRKARELRAKIMRHAQEMSKKLLRPTDKQHIPQKLQGAVAKLLESINLESNYTYDPNSKSYKRNDEGLPSQRTKAFAEIRKLYAEMASELVIDPDLLGEDGLLSEVAGLADKRIADMTSEELETVYQTMRAIEASVSSANKAFAESRWASIEEAAESIREDNKNKGQITEYRGFVGWGQKLTGLDMMTPNAFFHRLGESGDGLFRMLRNAQDKHIQLMKSVEDFTHKELEKVPVKKWEKETHTVKLGGENVTLTTAQIMELYVLTKRKQAQDHIFMGGILPESVDGKGIRKITRAEPVRGIDIGEVSKVVAKLTEEQKAVADKLQKYASTELSRWGNEAAMQVYNYEKFNESVYWPIRSNRQEIASTVEKDTQVTSVAGRGFSKNTKPNANTSVKIGSIFDTFATHSSEMATYAAWLAPAEDLNRIRNYTFLNEEGGRAGTVKGIIERVHGSRGSQYLQKLLSDIANGVGAGRGNETRMDQIVGNYKASAIGANLRVIIQQPTAVLRALDMIDPHYLASTKSPLSGWKKAKKYAPIAQWKDWGYFDINTGRQMKDVLFETDSNLERVKQFTMAGAGMADSFTWGALWNAVENETRATRKNLKPGSEDFYKAVAARFTEIVDHTQVVDGILQRSQIMRSADGLTKMATSFMGEPTKQYNMFMSALYDIRNKEGRERSIARKRMARTFVALVVSGVVNAAAQSIIDAVRDDDEEKEYWEKWLTQFFGLEGDEETTGDKIKAVAFSSNLMNIFNPAGYIPYAKDVVSIFQGYDVSRMDMESIEKTISAWNNLWKATHGEGNYTIQGAAINFIAEAARFIGVPAANLKREITSFATLAAQSSDNFLMQYYIEKVFTSVENSSKGVLDILYQSYTKDKTQFDVLYSRMLKDDELKKEDQTTADVIASKLKDKAVDDLYELYKTDPKAYEEMYNDLIERDFLKTGVKTDDPETNTFKSTAEHIATAMETRMKKEQGVDKVGEMEKRYFGPEQQREYDRKLQEIQSSSVWKNANEEQRESLEDNLRGIVNETDTRMLETIAEGAEYGLDDTEYLLYKLALETVDQPSENGKLGSYSNAEKAAAISSLNLGDSETAFLWDTDQAFEAFGYGIDMDKYITFKAEIGNIKADKDRNGKTISGSRKDKIIAYLNSLGVSYKDYLYLLGTEYDLSKDRDYRSYFGG